MTNDPQFGMKQTLRGYKDFEDVYQGMPIRNPVYLSATIDSSGRPPGAQRAWDSLRAEAAANPAGPFSKNDTGFDPYLMDSTPVPLGADCLLWLPYIGSPPYVVHYELIWMFLPVSEYRDTRSGYHDPVSGLGQPDSSIYTGAAALRKLRVSCREAVRFQQAEPIPGVVSNLYGNAVQRIWPLSVSTHPAEQLLAGGLLPNFIPGGAPVQGATQQGVFLNGNPLGGSPDYVTHDAVAKGDQLLIAVWREPAPGLDPDTDVYDFDGTDYSFSFWFGRCGFSVGHPELAPTKVPIPGLGVYLATGKR